MSKRWYFSVIEKLKGTKTTSDKFLEIGVRNIDTKVFMYFINISVKYRLVEWLAMNKFSNK